MTVLDLTRYHNSMISKEDCWLWAGSFSANGHGKIGIWLDGKSVSFPAYRVVYENLVGKIPEGLELDHLCENPPCVNPEHLEAVTHRENILRHYRNRKYCRNGHKLTSDNTKEIVKRLNISKANPRGVSRVCCVCINNRNARADRVI